MSLKIIVGEEQFVVSTIEFEELADAAARAGLTLNSRCGGAGVCHGCEVYLLSGRFHVGNRTVNLEGTGEHTEVDTLSKRANGARTESGSPRVLACQTQVVNGEATVRFPLSSVVETGAQIDELFDLSRFAFTPRSHPPRDDNYGSGVTTYGIAADIGTTTVVAVLVDLQEHQLLQKASMYNQQIGRADDVGSRISYASTPERLRELQQLIVEHTVNPLISILCARAGISEQLIRAVVVSGNTVMTHLFYGLSPEGIGSIPFEPVTNVYPILPASHMNIGAHPDAKVEAVPSVAGYIGGDLVSDIYVTGLAERNETTLLVDIGTNGEMILCHGGRLTACATAAGPAFEGAGLSCGARAAEGVIEHVSIDEALQPRYSVIGGDRAAKGICGSGIVDFIAEGMRAGIINNRGRYDVQRLKAAGRYHADGDPNNTPVHAFLLASGEESLSGESIFVSEYDLSQLLKAKAATFSGMKTLLEHVGLRFDQLNAVCLAGGFARYLHLDNAVHIGLMPEIPLERYELTGNASLAGAFLGLVDERAMPTYLQLIETPKVIELNHQPQFESNFIDALALPNMDQSLFPQHTQRTHAQGNGSSPETNQSGATPSHDAPSNRTKQRVNTQQE